MRKAISKKTRFEVFKRDGFACQYCGATAPDVVLHVDHINPVAGGGDNDILNLVTSCEPCNLGKGARTLDDKSAIAKQRAQLEELNQRREQLEMMLNWRQGMSDLDEQQIDAFNAEFETATGCQLNEHGRGKVKSWLKRHSLEDLLGGLDAAIGTYYKQGAADTEENNRLAGEAFNMTVRVLNARSRYADKPYMKDLFYVRAIIRNRCYCNDQKAIALLEEAYHAGVHIDDLKSLALQTKSWTTWHRNMTAWIEEAEQEGGQ
jgi:HNH endonuclease